MFEFLFKYPAGVFGRGHIVLLGTWPEWVLFASITAVAVALGILTWRRRSQVIPTFQGWRSVAIWALECALASVLLFLLWEPALSVAALKPQQNIIAVVVDDSRSMGVADMGSQTREQRALEVLRSGLVRELSKRFQVRLYKLGGRVERITDISRLQATEVATRIGAGLKELAAEATTLPIGAVVLLTDGSDNSGGIDLATLTEIRRLRIPVHTIGFGQEHLTKDVELEAFDVAPHALQNSRLEAQVTIRQNGFAGRQARLKVTESGAIVAARQIELSDAPEQTATVEFNAGKAGVKDLEASIEPLTGETDLANNRLTMVLAVDGTARRILYVEGEPRWEYKFLRRAAEDDPALHIVSMLRTTQNKIYRQGIANPHELEDGFPSQPEELFSYDGLIIGSVESAFFTPAQKESIESFVNRRGGGLLFLAGRWALSNGGYDVAPFKELLPVYLPQSTNTFQRELVPAELTDAGRNSLICRIEDDPEKSADHWEVLPYLPNYQDAGAPKPGALVLARVNANGKHLPLLITENYGRGRTAVFATAGSWRWRMQQPLSDHSQETFWRQLLRWVVAGTPSEVVATTSNALLEDDGKIELRADVRDARYLPAADAMVKARIIEPDGAEQTVVLRPNPVSPGIYSAEWNAAEAGSYVAEISATQVGKALGKDVATFRRENGVAENFHREQNRELLEKLATETGGHYYTPDTARRLPQEIAYSEAGVTTREMKDLWDMPAIFLALLLLRCGEWVLRRKWGAL
jgi:uncharacterized membrane protein